jgi:hypothetical protein
MGADLTRIYAEGICFFHGVDAKNAGATGTSPLRYRFDADFRGLKTRRRTRMGDADLRGWDMVFFGVDAKIVGATGTSPLRYQNIHRTMVVFADLTRIYADGDMFFSWR